MAKQANILIGVLVLQVYLAVGLMMNGTDSGAFASKQQLLGVKLDEIDKITITEKEGSPVLISKSDGKWLLPDHHEFPVSNDKVDGATGKLLDATVGWPVATTPSATKRFKVAADDFEKKVVFSGPNGISKTLYLGTSPGFKKIHARRDGDDNIYAINFSAYELAAKPNDWADQQYLHIDGEDVAEIELADVALKRNGDNFVVKSLADSEQTNASKASSLHSQLSNLSFLEVLGKTDKPEYQQNEPELTYSVLLKGGDQVSFKISKIADQDDYVLKPSNSEHYFKLAKHVVDGLKGFSRANLVEDKAKPQRSVEPSPEVKVAPSAESESPGAAAAKP